MASNDFNKGVAVGLLSGISLTLLAEAADNIIKAYRRGKNLPLVIAELEGENLRRLQDKGVFEGTVLDPNRGFLIA
jgi:hypothetical protein